MIEESTQDDSSTEYAPDERYHYEWKSWQEFCDIVVDVCENQAQELGIDPNIKRYYEASPEGIYRSIYNIVTSGIGEDEYEGHRVVKKIVTAFFFGQGISVDNQEKIRQAVINQLLDYDGEEFLSEKILDAQTIYEEEISEEEISAASHQLSLG